MKRHLKPEGAPYGPHASDDFLSSWLREGVEGAAGETETVNREAKEEEWKNGKREFLREKGKGGCGMFSFLLLISFEYG